MVTGEEALTEAADCTPPRTSWLVVNAGELLPLRYFEDHELPVSVTNNEQPE
jgi:hypothetical protein